MAGETALSIYKKLEYNITNIIFKLRNQEGFRFDVDELKSISQSEFVRCFDYYENDAQYLGFMFIVLKNKMKDIKKRELRYAINHVGNPATIIKAFQIVTDEGECTVRAYNEMAVSKELEPIDNLIRKDIIVEVKKRLNSRHYKEIFQMIVDGYPPKKIANELGFSVGHVGQVKKKHIWPAVKDVMKISDDKYKVLIDSGRIYC